MVQRTFALILIMAVLGVGWERPHAVDWPRTARLATPYDYEEWTGWEEAVDRAVADGANVILDWVALSDTYQGRILNPEPSLLEMEEHARYLHSHHPHVRYIVYIAPLEMITPGSDMDMDGVDDDGKDSTYTDHPDWLQMGIDGRRAVFYGSMPGIPFWVEPTDEDVWLCPNASEYHDLIMELAGRMASTGIDGVWFDVPFLRHDFGDGWQEQWPCHRDACRAKFQDETGYTLPEPPGTPNWDEPAWREFIAWRYAQTNGFIADFGEALKAVNPDIRLIIETSVGPDVSATQQGNTPLDLPGVSDLTAHEYTGPFTAVQYYAWPFMLSHLLFWRHTDGSRPSWLLSYVKAGHPDTVDVAKLHAGSVLAAGLNYYTSGDETMTRVVDEEFRRLLFTWLDDHEEVYYDAALAPYANVALLFSRQTLDYLDRGDWSSTHAYYEEWMGMAMMLLESHIPYRVITEDQIADLADYDALVLPFFGAMSAAQAQAIRDYVSGGGTIIATGRTSLYDERGVAREDFQLADVFGVHLDDVEEDKVYVNDYGAGRSIFCLYPYAREYLWAAAPWGEGDPERAEAHRLAFLEDMWRQAGVSPVIATDAPKGVMVLPYRRPGGLMVRLVNYEGVGAGDPIPTPQSGITVGLRLPGGLDVVRARRLEFMGDWETQPFKRVNGLVEVTLDLDRHAVVFFDAWAVYLPLIMRMMLI